MPAPGPMGTTTNRNVALGGTSTYGGPQYQPPAPPQQPAGSTLGAIGQFYKNEYNQHQDPMDQSQAGTGEKRSEQVSADLYHTPSQAETYNQTAQPQLANPFAGENYLADQITRLGTPGMNETYSTGQLAQNSSMTGADNTANKYYETFMENRPQVGYEAGLDPYYDLAKERSLEEVDRFGASRGVYGSSHALNMGQRSLADLNADQARNEADYKLRALGEERAWQGLGGQLADRAQGARREWSTALGGIAESGQNSMLGREELGQGSAGLMDQLAQGRVGLGSEVASRADDSWIKRLGGSAEAALAGQEAGDARFQRTFDNEFMNASHLEGINIDALKDIFGGDLSLLDAETAAKLGMTAQEMEAAGIKADAAGNAIGSTLEGGATGVSMGGAFTDQPMPEGSK